MRRHEFGTLDAVRGVAALVVVIWHVGLKFGVPVGSAYLAVDLFFMLSGFVVAHSYEGLLRDGWTPARFALVRVIRLWPLYLLCSGAGLLVATLAGQVQGSPPRIALGLVLMLPRRYGGSGVAYPFDDPAWSLACEIVANVAYGLAGWRLPTRALAAVSAVCFVAMALAARGEAALHVGLNLGALTAHLWIGCLRVGFAFPAGVVLHRQWQRGRLPRLRLPPWLPVTGAAAVLLVFPMPAPHSLAYALFAVGVAFPAIVAAGSQVEPRGRARALARLSARMSYPLYLVHMVLLDAALWLAMVTGVDRRGLLIAAGVLAVLVARPLDRYFDAPLRQWLSRRTGLRPGLTAAALPL